MPNLDFPASPTTGEQYSNWVYNGAQWDFAYFAQNMPGGLPAGSIIQWGGATAPANWYICDGSAISRTANASLFNAIGTTYGAGDGSTTFNLPDLRGRVPVGKNGGSFGTLGATGGSETHTLTEAQMPSHTHVQNAHNHTQDAHNHSQNPHDHALFHRNVDYYASTNVNNWPARAMLDPLTYGYNVSLPANTATNNPTTATNQATTATNQNTGGGQPHNIVQPYQVVNYIIKATAASTPGDSELTSRVGVLETADATTNKSGLVPVIPTSVAVGSGTGSVSSAGLFTFSGASSMSMNGVFTSAYKNYLIQVNVTSANAASGVLMRFRLGGNDYPYAVYNYAYYELQASLGALAFQSATSQTTARIMRSESTGGFSGDINVFSPQEYGYTRAVSRSDDTSFFAQGGFAYLANDQFDGFSITGGTSFTGTMRVYGYR